ncbi:hypothetical protein JQC92_22065, partial [Shewanella sp. 202IG2-18]|uniref:hypothetical protein n=1 Tax=Parashewanella hymeniacidonis TaxID=2807618 RepID=UPI00195FB386
VDFSAPILLCYISLKESRYSFANAPQRIGAEKVLKHASSSIGYMEQFYFELFMYLDDFSLL